jgi:hypothetical protein
VRRGCRARRRDWRAGTTDIEFIIAASEADMQVANVFFDLTTLLVRNCVHRNVRYRHLAENPFALVFVRFWTKVNKGRFWSPMGCPLMTQSGRKEIKLVLGRTAAQFQIGWQLGQDSVEFIAACGNSDAALVFNSTE